MTQGDDSTRAAVGGEDVLDGHVPQAPTPGPRTRFNRKRDYAVLGVIVVALVAAGVAAWRTSDIRATTSTTTEVSYAAPPAPEFFPPSLGEVWRANSPATWEPVAVGPAVVTGEGGEVVGRDPETGDVRWSYGRDIPLCTVTGAFSKVIAAHRTPDNDLPESDPRHEGGCSEITALDPTSGKRDAQRNSDAESGTRLIGDGTYVTATGARLLTTVRSDLVETVEYGVVPAIVNPQRQPRTDCVYGSVAMTPGKVGVIERCAEDQADRLTVYKASGKDADKPEVVTSVVLGSESARIVAMNDKLTAVAIPDPGRIVVYSEDGSQTMNYEVDLGLGDLRTDPEGRTPLTTAATGAFYWFTGSRTVVLSATELRPLWTIQDTLGPGTVFAGRALLPVRDGIAVHSQADGSRVGEIPVDREGYSGVVTMNSIGPMVLEQRGMTLVALH
ncbi:Rv3212 family protein [Actinokineospora sp.]|uniref:Rv3212 family protein n=1 Tax=Actinokineospora sp. TaxID=1872133 RepID=UPI004037683B